MLKKLKDTVTDFIKGFRTVWQEYERISPTSPKQYFAAVMFSFMLLIFALAFAEPIRAIIKFLFYSVGLLIVVTLAVLFLRGMYHKNNKYTASAVYPVYFGHNGVCWNDEKINDEFHEIESCFQTCYFTCVNEQDNTIVYYFRFLPKRELPISYELLQLLQRMGEKMAAKNFHQYGISAIYENVVACGIRGDYLMVMFAKNENGIPSVVSMQNIVYQNYHTPQYQVDPVMEENIEDNMEENIEDNMEENMEENMEDDD